jgi:DNA-binding protein HU-beta
MTKAEVINALASRTGMARKEAADAVELFLASVLDALQRGEKVSLVGFGTFYLKQKKPRQGRNPRTGDRIEIPRKQVATFKPGKMFRQMVNGMATVTPSGRPIEELSPQEEKNLPAGDNEQP